MMLKVSLKFSDWILSEYSLTQNFYYQPLQPIILLMPKNIPNNSLHRPSDQQQTLERAL